DIEQVILTEFVQRMGRSVSRSEVHSWQGSLVAVARVVKEDRGALRSSTDRLRLLREFLATPTDANLGKCRGLSKTSGLKGDLGIKEIFETGLGYTTDRPVKTGQPPQDKYPY